MGRRCAQLAGYSLADWASGAIHCFPRPYRKVVGWNTGTNAEMIQAAQSAFGAVMVGLQPGHIQPAIVIVTRARG
jgi:hypothetical protein